MSASPTRVVAAERSRPADPGFPLQEGNKVLESLAQQRALGALHAFSSLHAQIQERRRGEKFATADADLLQTERFVFDEVLQLICDRAQKITKADGVMIALSEGASFVCRASSGSLLLERGMHLLTDSEFLQDALDSHRILRCDDCAVDGRVEMDISRPVGARSTIIVPLRGRQQRIGALQAFASAPFAFNEDDARSFDLFAELILAALRPEDQDRRLNWLADVADNVLEAEADAIAAETATAADHIKGSEDKAVDFQTTGSSAVDSDELRELPTLHVTIDAPSASPTFEASPPLLSGLAAWASERPGLSVVAILVLVAGLFSAGVWWGMSNHSGREFRPEIVSVPKPAVTAPPAPSPTALSSDHLLDVQKFVPDGSTPTPATAAQLAVLPKITGVRHWSSAVGSTVVIDMDDQVPYEVHRLSSPERIYFDLHDTALAPDLDGKTLEIGDASLTKVRVAQPLAGITRIVLDTKDGSNFAVSMESNPYRLVIELRGNDRAVQASRVPPPEAVEKNRQKLSALSPVPIKPEDEQLRAKIGRFRIVLDAGHGGWDLGTVGREGLLEKDLVLDVTERLGKLLASRLGADVIYTRTSDDYLPLDQRAEIANQSQADLFVSVHANYSNLTNARGVETYYTNFFSAPGSREVESRENGPAAKPLQVQLSPNELKEKVESSRDLAASVQKALYSTLAALTPGLRDRGVKGSSFVVLTGTAMPAVLTEISFVSSPTDEHNLQSEPYRQHIAEALYKGISRYEATAHRVQTAEVQSDTAHR
jgi:N-acetylmuramoyl-L-alanine amidase